MLAHRLVFANLVGESVPPYGFVVDYIRLYQTEPTECGGYVDHRLLSRYGSPIDTGGSVTQLALLEGTIRPERLVVCVIEREGVVVVVQQRGFGQIRDLVDIRNEQLLGIRNQHADVILTWRILKASMQYVLLEINIAVDEQTPVRAQRNDVVDQLISYFREIEQTFVVLPITDVPIVLLHGEQQQLALGGLPLEKFFQQTPCVVGGVVLDNVVFERSARVSPLKLVHHIEEEVLQIRLVVLEHADYRYLVDSNTSIIQVLCFVDHVFYCIGNVALISILLKYICIY